MRLIFGYTVSVPFSGIVVLTGCYSQRVVSMHVHTQFTTLFSYSTDRVLRESTGSSSLIGLKPSAKDWSEPGVKLRNREQYLRARAHVAFFGRGFLEWNDLCI